MSAEQRAELIELAHHLLADGLVVRTWGNFSLRTADDRFVITPSGRRYDTMLENDLTDTGVDGKWVGPYKPSSEHPMHAIVYKLFPQAGCVLHTHQPYASALSLAGKDHVLPAGAAENLGQSVLPVSPYALPSTGFMHRNAEKTLRRSKAHVVLLEKHGALIWAETSARARELGNALEDVARSLYRRAVGVLDEPEHPGAHSERAEVGMSWFRDGKGQVADMVTRTAHARIYRSRPDVEAIVTSHDPEVTAFYGKTLRPYLDDFAQLVGTRADTTTNHNVLLTEKGAYCMGSNRDEAIAVRLVLEKNARAARYAQSCGAKPIVEWESILMNQVYRRKYSKQSA